MRSTYFFLMMLLAGFLSAQVPRTMHYQGIARNAAGDPVVNKTIAIKFSLRSTSTQSVVFTEVQPVITNQFGLFSTEIGSLISIDPAVDFNTDKYELGIAMDANGGSDFKDLGYQALSAVPYALSAADVVSSFSPLSGVLTIGRNTYTLSAPASYSAGTGIAINSGSIINTQPDATVTIDGGANVSVSGSYPNFTVATSPTLNISGNNLSISNGNTVALPVQSTTVSGAGAVTVTTPTAGSFVVAAPVTTLSSGNSNISVTGSFPSFSVSSTPTLSVNGQSLSISDGNTVTLPASTTAISGTGAISVATLAGNSYSLSVPITSISPGNSNVSVSGSFPSFTVSSAPTLAIQSQSLVISNGNTVTLPTPTFVTSGAVSVNSISPNTYSVSVPATSFVPGNSNISVSGTFPSFTVSGTPSLTVNGQSLSISNGNTVVLPANSTSVTGQNAAVVTSTATGVYNVNVQTPSITAGNSNILVSGGYPSFTVSAVPSLILNALDLSISNSNTVTLPTYSLSQAGNTISLLQNGASVATAAIAGTANLSLAGNVLSAGGSPVTLNSYTAGSGISIAGAGPSYTISAAAANATVTGSGAAAVTPSTGLSFSINVPPTTIAMSNSVGALSAVDSGTNTFNINVPPPQYDRTLSVLSTGSSSTVISPSLSLAGNVLSVGPSTNNIALPTTVVTATSGIATVASNSNTYNVNVPAPLYNSTLSTLSMGSSSTVISPSLSLAGNVLSVGPSTNNIALPTAVVTATSGIATIASNSNTYNVNVPAPLYNSTLSTLSMGTASTVISPSLNLAGNVLSVGPSTNVVTLPMSSVTASGIATASQTGNTYNINVNGPSFNALTGVLSVGTGSTPVVPSLTLSGNVLSVGVPSNNVTLPAQVTPTITPSGVVTVSSTGFASTVNVPQSTVTALSGIAIINSAGTNSFDINVPAPVYNANTGVLNMGSATANITPTLSYVNNVLTVGPSTNNIAVPATSVAASGLAVISASTANSYTVNVPALTYTASTGVLASGANAVSINPQLALNSQVLRVGASTNTVDLAPIAPWALSSNSITAINTSAFVGIGTSNPQENLSVESTSSTFLGLTANSSSFATLSFGNPGNHSMGMIRYDNNTNSLNFATNNTINRLFIDNSGNIGVNTTTPGVNSGASKYLTLSAASSYVNAPASFEMVGAYPGTITPFARVDFNSVGVSGTSSNVARMAAYNAGTVGQGVLAFSTRDGSSLLERMRIDETGKVGIGTTAPTASLHVNGTFRLADGTEGANKQLVSDAQGNGTWQTSTDWSTNGNAGTVAAFNFIGTTDNQSLGFRTNSVERMRVSSNGNIGIGTTTPASKLHIAVTYGTFKLYDLTPAANTILMGEWQGTTPNAPQMRWSISGSSNFMDIGLNSSGDFVVEGNDQPRLNVTNGGNVGIGTTAPTSTLHVNGTVRLVTGNEGNGKALTSDANGNASWTMMVPPGAIMAYGGSSIPSGWALCDGSALSRTTYSLLYSAIGTNWGYGDGSTTFNVPDMRGMFLRGVDGSAGVDPDKTSRTAVNTGGNTGNNVGSAQTDQYRSHTHTLSNHNSTNTFNTLLGGSTGWVPGGTATTNSSGGNETRPANVYVYYIIKL